MRIPTPFRLLLLLLVCACSVPAAEALHAAKSVDLLVYQEGEVALERTLALSDRKLRPFVAWIDVNLGGWLPDERDYAPGVLLRTPSFTLNILPAVVVFGAQGEQHIHRLREDDYQRILKALLNERP